MAATSANRRKTPGPSICCICPDLRPIGLAEREAAGRRKDNLAILDLALGRGPSRITFVAELGVLDVDPQVGALSSRGVHETAAPLVDVRRPVLGDVEHGGLKGRIAARTIQFAGRCCPARARHPCKVQIGREKSVRPPAISVNPMPSTRRYVPDWKSTNGVVVIAPGRTTRLTRSKAFQIRTLVTVKNTSRMTKWNSSTFFSLKSMNSHVEIDSVENRDDGFEGHRRALSMVVVASAPQFARPLAFDLAARA